MGQPADTAFLVAYDLPMVAASVVIGIMASFTGLRLAGGLGRAAGADDQTRRRRIARAAFVLGGGIWSMHFVGMLAVRLPVSVTYDALYTLGSVLISILITGVGLALMTAAPRTLPRTAAAGTLTGLGIVSMHYVGMEAIGGNCIVGYLPSGIAISIAIALLFSICALWLAFGHRSLAQLSLGAVVLGVTIAGMHYSAMLFTRFMPAADIIAVATPTIDNGALAMIVAVAAFVVCGLFLLTAMPGPSLAAAGPAPSLDPPMPTAPAPPEPAPARPAPAADAAAPPAPAAARADGLRLPYEHNNATFFVEAGRIQAIRADGHYARLYDGEADYFCPWSISKLEAHLSGRSFMRTHRSFLVNLDHARAFRRKRDKAYLVVPGLDDMVPVSRAHVADVRRALGL